jgi:peptide/nickel transport system permease protein
LQHLVPTITLALNALIVASVGGLLLGVLGALELRRGISALARGIIDLSLSTPIYWTGTIAIYIFSAQLGLLPSAGAGRVSQLILPVAVLGFHTAGAIARVVQANVRDTLDADFVRVARAKGLSERAVIWRHVLRASLLPVVTVIALQAGFLLSGTVITESLFVRPGIGRLMLDAVTAQDYPVVQGVVIFAAIVYAVLNVMADTLYRIVDPRVAR